MKVKKFLPKPLPKYFFQNVIQLENTIKIEPKLFDVKSICILYQRAIEFYSFKQNFIMVKAYQNKLKELTENKEILTLLSQGSIENNIYNPKKASYENLQHKIEQRAKNEVVETSLLRRETNEYMTTFSDTINDAVNSIEEDMQKQSMNMRNKIRDMKLAIKRKQLLTSADKAADTFRRKKRATSIVNVDRRKARKLTYNYSMGIMPGSVKGKNGSAFVREKMKLDDIFGKNLLDKINYLCMSLYDKKLGNLNGILSKVYEEKLGITLEFIETTKEIDLMIQEVDGDEKIPLKAMKETMEQENKKKNEELFMKTKEILDKERSMIQIEDLIDNEEIDDINTTLFNNVIKAIVI